MTDDNAVDAVEQLAVELTDTVEIEIIVNDNAVLIEDVLVACEEHVVIIFHKALVDELVVFTGIGLERLVVLAEVIVADIDNAAVVIGDLNADKAGIFNYLAVCKQIQIAIKLINAFKRICRRIDAQILGRHGIGNGPAGEGEVGRADFGRICGCSDCCAVCVALGGIDLAVHIVGDGVFPDNLRIGRRIGSVSISGADCRCPACEGIVVLRVCLPCGGIANIFGGIAVCCGGGIEQASIVVYKIDGVNGSCDDGHGAVYCGVIKIDGCIQANGGIARMLCEVKAQGDNLSDRRFIGNYHIEVKQYTGFGESAAGAHDAEADNAVADCVCGEEHTVLDYRAVYEAAGNERELSGVVAQPCVHCMGFIVVTVDTNCDPDGTPRIHLNDACAEGKGPQLICRIEFKVARRHC